MLREFQSFSDSEDRERFVRGIESAISKVEPYFIRALFLFFTSLLIESVLNGSRQIQN